MVQLGFDNTYARELTGLYLPVEPRGFAAPEALAFDEGLRQSLGLPDLDPEVGVRLYSGSVVAEDASPLAMAYAGHQFGGFSPQLGDGRAVLLGEVVDPEGQRWDLQLKGSGPTPFSRGGDGFAAVGPILREYLVSRAMHHLGVPTTRVLSAVLTGESIRRERWLPGAVLVRVASSHIRVGSFQFFAFRRDEESLSRLLDYTVRRHLPEAIESERPALALLKWVAERQAELIASWMDVGFVHGVMNTDNFTISGETLDYGPCAFVDAYDPAAVFSSIDYHGRYAYGNQARVGQWNLARFGETLLPLIDPEPEAAVDRVREVLGDYGEAFWSRYQARRRRKIGLTDTRPEDTALVEDLLEWMHRGQVDYTQAFRRLAESLRSGDPAFQDPGFAAWDARWRARLGTADLAAIADGMDGVNPKYIPRNHLVEEALVAAEAGDLEPFRRLEAIGTRPYQVQEVPERFAEPPPPGSPPCVTYCGT